MATFPTVTAFIVALALSVFKAETVDFLKAESINSYRIESVEAQQLSDEEVLEKISEDEKEVIRQIDDLSPVLVGLLSLLFILLVIYQVGKIYGELHADGIRVSERQFPQVHAMWVEMAGELGMKKVPELYIKNGNGALNAFATCMLGYRAFGAIYLDILERALANDDEKAL